MMDKHETALGILDRPGEERQYFKMPTRYDFATDEMVPVTQEWVDMIGRHLSTLGRARYQARQALLQVNDLGVLECQPYLQAFLDAWKPECN